jgi:hypothetical protein
LQIATFVNWRSVGDQEQAIKEIREVLEQVALNRGTVAYSEVVSQLNAMRLEPDSKLFAAMLDEISRQTDEEGLGMLSAVVVHKGDDYLPGRGFFKLGRELGRDSSDKVAFHSAELQQVHDSFAH